MDPHNKKWLVLMEIIFFIKYRLVFLGIQLVLILRKLGKLTSGSFIAILEED